MKLIIMFFLFTYFPSPSMAKDSPICKTGENCNRFDSCKVGMFGVGTGAAGPALLVCVYENGQWVMNSNTGKNWVPFFKAYENDKAFVTLLETISKQKYADTLKSLESTDDAIEIQWKSVEELKFIAAKYKEWLAAKNQAEKKKAEITVAAFDPKELEAKVKGNETLLKALKAGGDCKAEAKFNVIKLTFTDKENLSILPVEMTPIENKKGHYTIRYLRSVGENYFEPGLESYTREIVFPEPPATGDIQWINEKKGVTSALNKDKGFNLYNTFLYSKGATQPVAEMTTCDLQAISRGVPYQGSPAAAAPASAKK